MHSETAVAELGSDDDGKEQFHARNWETTKRC